MALSYWGGHFPEPSEGALSYWGGHFPEGDDDPGLGDPGVATFQIALDVGATLTFAWRTHIDKARSGVERRSSVLDKPIQRYAGPMLLLGDQRKTTRAQLAQYAQLGLSFLIGLTYEAVPILAPYTTSGDHYVLSVPSTASLDWAGEGQRVLVSTPNGSSAVTAVIVEVGASSLTIDMDPGAGGNPGGRVMPAMSSLLDPAQAFARQQNEAETWRVTARAALFDYADFQRATLSLSATTVFAGAEIYALQSGELDYDISVTFVDDGVTQAGTITTGLILGSYAVTVHFEPGVSTVADVVALIQTSTIIGIRGTYTGTDVLTAADEVFGFLAGGSSDYAETGKTATVDTFRDVPVWDRGITLEGTAQDSLQSMHDVEDLGGVPFATGAATASDWGRALNHTRQLADRDEWQWLLKFLDTVKGQFRTFWLPTYGEDMAWTSSAAGKIVIESDDGLSTWFPSQRTCIQIVQADGTVTYARVTTVSDNGDGTADVSIVDEEDAAITLSASDVEIVSWLELCHLESDEVAIAFGGGAFALQTQARVVQR